MTSTDDPHARLLRRLLELPVEGAAPPRPPIPEEAGPDEVRAASESLIAAVHDRFLSMLPEARLRRLADLVIERRGRPGALVECGVAKGGALAVMAHLAGPHQTTWGFDSFDAMPPLTDEDEGDGQIWVGARCAGPQGADAVTASFTALGVSMARTRVVPGWFEDTLEDAVAELAPIQVLRLDNDWYRSTRYTLEILYPHVAPGGAVIIDDYFEFSGCRRAVDEYRTAHGIEHPLIPTPGDDSEVHWVA